MISFLQLIGLAATFTLASSAWHLLLAKRRFDRIDLPAVWFFLPWLLRLLLPSIPFINPKNRTAWSSKFTTYQELRASCYQTVHPGNDAATVFLADPGAVKQVSLDRKSWAKPLKMYRPLAFFGDNLVCTEGATWKTHRRIIQPSFTESAYADVWSKTKNAFREMIGEEKLDEIHPGEERQLDDIVRISMRLTCVIIARAAFSIPMAYNERATSAQRAQAIKGGHKLTASEAINFVSGNLIAKLVLPNWAYKLPLPRVTPYLQKVETAFVELESHMRELIQERREEIERGERGSDDLFASLVRASSEENDNGEPVLGDRELLGNTFVFLLAGHETTGHSLALAYTLLALNPDVQAKLYEEVSSVLPNPDSDPTYQDYHKLPYTQAVFYETMRLFPPAPFIPKTAVTDTTLTFKTIPRNEGEPAETKTIFIPKGTDALIDAAALHTNPAYWPDPHTFNPDRFFLNEYNKDAFVPFSTGPRACVGRRFAEVEGVCLLALFSRRFEFKLPELKKGERSREEMEARLLKVKSRITLTPKDIDLVLKRRY